MYCQLQFCPYCRKFSQPLKTNHGLWSIRQGILIRLVDSAGQSGFGEIAPLPWFGSETFEQALEFCQQLPAQLSADIIWAIPPQLPACQFGLESAWQAVKRAESITSNRFDTPCRQSALLPSGKAALQVWRSLWEQGYETFKWKIGVGSLEEELQAFELLLQSLPSTAKLRLDANGGLTWEAAQRWLQYCDALATRPSPLATLEFLEQPLPVDCFDTMLQLSQQYATPLALDESVASLEQLQFCYEQGWSDVFVIKPAIAGSPTQLRQFCQQHSIDIVFSSALETAIGRQAGLQLAAELSHPERAAGYGVNHWFEQDGLDNPDFEHLWQSL